VPTWFRAASWPSAEVGSNHYDNLERPMSEPQESITVTTRQDGDTAVIELTGELDMHSSPVLTTAVAAALDSSPTTIGIDARGLSFADSAGLRSLLLARTHADERGVTLRVTHVSEPLDRLLEITGLREILGVPVI
jgi:anti-anti-sigma factor